MTKRYRKKERVVYLRFLNSIIAFGVVVTYSNPASISLLASFALVVTLQVNSFNVARNNADSMFMYIIVLSMFLCPKTVLT